MEAYPADTCDRLLYKFYTHLRRFPGKRRDSSNCDTKNSSSVGERPVRPRDPLPRNDTIRLRRCVPKIRGVCRQQAVSERFQRVERVDNRACASQVPDVRVESHPNQDRRSDAATSDGFGAFVNPDDPTGLRATKRTRHPATP